MGLAFPIAMILVMIEGVALAVAIVGSWRKARAEVLTHWRRWLVVTSVPSVFPVLLFFLGAIDDWSRGYWSMKPLLLLLLALAFPAVAAFKFLSSRRFTKSI